MSPHARALVTQSSTSNSMAQRIIINFILIVIIFLFMVDKTTCLLISAQNYKISLIFQCILPLKDLKQFKNIRRAHISVSPPFFTLLASLR